MRLRIASEAERDLENLHLYGVVRYGEQPADAYVEAIIDQFRHIAEWPLAAPERKEIRPPIRLRPFRGHNIFYDVAGDHVLIVRILHHTADWLHEL